MQLLEIAKEDYINTQIRASHNKFKYCKVSVVCVIDWRSIIERREKITGSILCLGTRNGREIDLFRNVFFSNVLKIFLIWLFERRKYCFSSWLPFIESWSLSRNKVFGVDLNPDSKRDDVLICSFDDLPAEWTEQFQIVFANTLDHAIDPYKAASEWNRVLKPGGYYILSFKGKNDKPTKVDPTGAIELSDILKLFPGELIYYNKYGNVFEDVIIKKCN